VEGAEEAGRGRRRIGRRRRRRHSITSSASGTRSSVQPKRLRCLELDDKLKLSRLSGTVRPRVLLPAKRRVGRDPRCIRATRSRNNACPQLFCLHEAVASNNRPDRVSAMQMPLRSSAGGCLSDQTTAICCMGGVVRNGRSGRLGRCCQARRIRFVGHREYRNADRGRQGDARRSVSEPWRRGPRRTATRKRNDLHGCRGGVPSQPTRACPARGHIRWAGGDS
jgi:hypothetical protein